MMPIHEIIIYTYSGLSVATYRGERELDLTPSFFTATRLFAMENGFGDIRQITWMKKKCYWDHDPVKELSFALITDVDENDEFMVNYLQLIKEGFLTSLNGDERFHVIKDGDHDLKLTRVLDGLIRTECIMCFLFTGTAPVRFRR